MDGQPGAALAVLDPQPANPAASAATPSGQSRDGHGRGRAGPARGVRDRAARTRSGAARRDLDLDRRLEPVEVGALEQPDLDEAHGPGRIARPRPPAPPSSAAARPVDCGHGPTLTDTPGDGSSRAGRARPRLESSRRSARPSCRPSSPTSSGSSTSTAAATRRPASTRSARWTARFLERLGAAVERRPDPTAARRHGRRRRSTAGAGGPRVLLIGHMDTVFDPGTAAERPFAIEDGHRARAPGVTDMKAGLLAGLYALAGRSAPRRREAAGCRSSASSSSPTRTRRSARRRRRPHIRELAARRRRLLRARVRPRQRRHRLGAQGHRRPPPHGPRPGRARRRRAREGPQRDPRGGPPDRRPPRAQRPLARRDGQRRRHPRRHPPERRRRARAILEVDVRATTARRLEAAEAAIRVDRRRDRPSPT